MPVPARPVITGEQGTEVLVIGRRPIRRERVFSTRRNTPLRMGASLGTHGRNRRSRRQGGMPPCGRYLVSHLGGISEGGEKGGRHRQRHRRAEEKEQKAEERGTTSEVDRGERPRGGRARQTGKTGNFQGVTLTLPFPASRLSPGHTDRPVVSRAAEAPRVTRDAGMPASRPPPLPGCPGTCDARGHRGNGPAVHPARRGVPKGFPWPLPA